MHKEILLDPLREAITEDDDDDEIRTMIVQIATVQNQVGYYSFTQSR